MGVVASGGGDTELEEELALLELDDEIELLELETELELLELELLELETELELDTELDVELDTELSELDDTLDEALDELSVTSGSLSPPPHPVRDKAASSVSSGYARDIDE